MGGILQVDDEHLQRASQTAGATSSVTLTDVLIEFVGAGGAQQMPEDQPASHAGAGAAPATLSRGRGVRPPVRLGTDRAKVDPENRTVI
ncbi:hypothetical protein CKO27_23255 [Thiocystis violacea]|nr:hypothetical protein [Thiocystis violacea]